jgi:hypothetical protein
MDEKFIEHLIERFNLPDVDFKKETIFAGDAMTFRYGRHAFRELRDFWQAARERSYPHESGNRVAQRFRIELQLVAGNDPAFLQAQNPFFSRRVRHPDLASQLGDRNPRILLQQSQDGDIFVIRH